jgi:hypothetical protein
MIQKHRLLLIIIGMLLVISSTAQHTIVSIAGLGGIQLQGKLKWSSMDRFIDSYNACLANQLTDPVAYMKLTPGYLWGIEGQYGPFQFGFTHANAIANSKASLINGEQRLFELDSYFNEFYLSLAYPADACDIGFICGTAIHKGLLMSSYIYKDGTPSFGEDKPLNGVFDLGSHAEITFGPRLDFGYKWLKLSLRFEYQGLFGKNGRERQAVGEGYRDFFMSNVGPDNLGIFSDGSTHVFLPEDWNDQNNYNAYYAGTLPGVKFGYAGWRFTLIARFAPLYQHKKD